MAKFVFGSGALYGISLQNGIQTPVRFGTLQDVSFETSATVKELFGGDQFAEEIRRGTIKVSGKAKFAQINGVVLNSLYFGANMVDGMTRMSDRESGTITDGKVTVAHAGTFVQDYGVVYAASGLAMLKTASLTPAVGQYSVDENGVYTFNTGDNGKDVAISYLYTEEGGKTISVYSQPLGTTPKFEVFLKDANSDFGIHLYSCTAAKLSMATKLEDYMVPEFDFTASKRADRKVLEIYTAE